MAYIFSFIIGEEFCELSDKDILPTTFGKGDLSPTDSEPAEQENWLVLGKGRRETWANP